MKTILGLLILAFASNSFAICWSTADWNACVRAHSARYCTEREEAGMNPQAAFRTAVPKNEIILLKEYDKKSVKRLR